MTIFALFLTSNFRIKTALHFDEYHAATCVFDEGKGLLILISKINLFLNSNRRVRPEGRSLDDYMAGAGRLLRQIESDREIVARFDQTWKEMADACRQKDLNKIAQLLKADNDKKQNEENRLRNAYANPQGEHESLSRREIKL